MARSMIENEANYGSIPPTMQGRKRIPGSQLPFEIMKDSMIDLTERKSKKS